MLSPRAVLPRRAEPCPLLETPVVYIGQHKQERLLHHPTVSPLPKERRCPYATEATATETRLGVFD